MSIRNDIINRINEEEHNIRRGFNSKVNAQLDELVKLLNRLKEEKGIALRFDNSTPNHYRLELNGNVFEFSLYRDVKNALLLMLEV